MTPAIVLIAAGAVVAYILIGYPLLLALARGRAAAPVRKNTGYRTTVSVILAVHNGAAFVGQKIESILALDYPRSLMEILIVSDGSTDDTEAIVERFASQGVRLVKQPRSGKAAALNRALQLVSGEILFFTDVRQRLEPAALAHLVANFADPAVGAATGEMR